MQVSLLSTFLCTFSELNVEAEFCDQDALGVQNDKKGLKHQRRTTHSQQVAEEQVAFIWAVWMQEKLPKQQSQYLLLLSIGYSFLIAQSKNDMSWDKYFVSLLAMFSFLTVMI